MFVSNRHRDFAAWLLAAALACALLVWTTFNFFGRSGEIGFSILLLFTFLSIVFVAWRGTVAQRHRQEESENLLHAAVEGLPHGFELYDADDRLVMCNEMAKVFEPKIKDILKPGVKFETTIRLKAEAGFIPDAVGRVDEWVADRMIRHRNPMGVIDVSLTMGAGF